MEPECLSGTCTPVGLLSVLPPPYPDPTVCIQDLDDGGTRPSDTGVSVRVLLQTFQRGGDGLGWGRGVVSFVLPTSTPTLSRPSGPLRSIHSTLTTLTHLHNLCHWTSVPSTLFTCEVVICLTNLGCVVFLCLCIVVLGVSFRDGSRCPSSHPVFPSLLRSDLTDS